MNPGRERRVLTACPAAGKVGRCCVQVSPPGARVRSLKPDNNYWKMVRDRVYVHPKAW